jgi:hypothetical protein
MLVYLLTACAHMTASWVETPDARVDVSGAAMAIVVDDRRCQGIADALVRELQRRDGVRVSPDAVVRLALSRCEIAVRSEVDISQLYSGLGTGLGGGTEVRDEVVRAVGTVAMTVEVDGRPQTTLGARSHRVRRLSDTDRTQGRLSLTDGVARDIAVDLAQQVAPEPEVVRRRVYRDPETGSARALHNAAVEAERSGDLSRALELARRAAGAAPTAAHQGYLEALEARLEQRRYVEAD